MGLVQQAGRGGRQPPPAPERITGADRHQRGARSQPPAGPEGQPARQHQQAADGHGDDPARNRLGAVEQQHRQQHQQQVQAGLQVGGQRALDVIGQQRFGGGGVQLQPRDAAGLGPHQRADEEIARAQCRAAQQHLLALQLRQWRVAAQQRGCRDPRGRLREVAGQQGCVRVPAPLQQHVQCLGVVRAGLRVDQRPRQRGQMAFFQEQAAHQAVTADMEADVAEAVATGDQVQRIERQVVVGAFFLAHRQDHPRPLAGGVLQAVAQELILVRLRRDLGKEHVDGQRLGVGVGDPVDQRRHHRA